MEQRITDLPHIMRGDIRRHAHRNTRGPIGQQIGKTGGQNLWLRFLSIIGIAKINRILINALQQSFAQIRSSRASV